MTDYERKAQQLIEQYEHGTISSAAVLSTLDNYNRMWQEKNTDEVGLIILQKIPFSGWVHIWDSSNRVHYNRFPIDQTAWSILLPVPGKYEFSFAATEYLRTDTTVWSRIFTLTLPNGVSWDNLEYKA